MAKTARMEFITAEVHRKIINQELFDMISKVNIRDGQYEEILLTSNRVGKVSDLPQPWMK
jgi:hypothetical protein